MSDSPNSSIDDADSAGKSPLSELSPRTFENLEKSVFADESGAVDKKPPTNPTICVEPMTPFLLSPCSPSSHTNGHDANATATPSNGVRCSLLNGDKAHIQPDERVNERPEEVLAPAHTSVAGSHDTALANARARSAGSIGSHGEAGFVEAEYDLLSIKSSIQKQETSEKPSAALNEDLNEDPQQHSIRDISCPINGAPNETRKGTSQTVAKSEDSQTLQPHPSQSENGNASSTLSTLTDVSELSMLHSVGSSQATTPVDAGDSLDTIVEHPRFNSPAPAELTSIPNTRSPALELPQAQNGIRDAFTPAPTPCLTQQNSLPASPFRTSTPSKRSSYKVRPKSSIPLDLHLHHYAGQCIAAAESSRLNPYALHVEEYELLRHHISHGHVTTYLNIRNGILRLWLRKPHIAITRHEAIGCAKEYRWFDAASVCFDWLVRRGYINYGCVEIREPRKDKKHSRPEKNSSFTASHKRKKRIAIIGAGMSGLGCARQLHNLIRQYSDQFNEIDEELPEVVVLEGRDRIGGRVYSRAFEIQPQHVHPDFPQSRCTAEMGGMIVTGFDRGNPMNTLVRGQLGLGYHALLSTTTIYDIDGEPVDAVRDGMVENLFNECLDRVSEYKFKLPAIKTVEGNRSNIDEGRDSSSEGHRTIAHVEAALEARAAAVAAAAAAEQTTVPIETKAILEVTATEALAGSGVAQLPLRTSATAEADTSSQVDLVPVSSDRLTGRAHLEPGTHGTLKAAHKVQIMGWELKPGVTESRDLDLDPATNTAGATFGFVVEEAIKQYGELVDLNAQDFRLLNWHIANLEYSNAINHNCLSLLGWDLDAGNEWDGKHSMIVGGYQSVPRGLMLCPTPLDVRRQMVVKKITYAGTDDSCAGNGDHDMESDKAPVVIECENGDTIEADYVVNTIPLGVLKHGNVEFSPPLPAWKTDAIDRIGYGVLNKVILTYRQAFWDPERDIFGVLREPSNRFSLNQKEYSRGRGRMFQWFNVTKTTGMPCLVALMAGDAAFDTEKTSNDKLVSEATSVLRSVFGADRVPEPIEAVVTRWVSDKFSRGSYSSAGPNMKIDDYDQMARSVGKHLHFAGEHTIGTYPATVHGAYLSGVRAASNVFEELLGPIQVPTPLVVPKEAAMAASAVKRKFALDDDEGKAGGGGDESSGSASAGGSGNSNSNSNGNGNGSGSGSGYREAKANSRKRMEDREIRIQEYIVGQIGNQPVQPPKAGDTSYLLFSRANYERARKKCEEGRRPGKGRALPNEVRVLTSKMWRSASAEERRPYAEQAAAQKKKQDEAVREFTEKAAEWAQRAMELRAAYELEHPDDAGRGGDTAAEVANNGGIGLSSVVPTASSATATPDHCQQAATSEQVHGDDDVNMTG